MITAAFGALVVEWSMHKDNVAENAVAIGAVRGQYDDAKAKVPLANPTSPRAAAPATGGTKAPTFRSPSGAGANFSASSSRSYPVAGAKPYPVAGAKPYPVSRR